MICDECGCTQLHWRCDNHEKQTTKYKCQNCGKIITIKKTQKTPLFDEEEIKQIEQNKEKIIQENRVKGGKTLWQKLNAKNYAKNYYGTYTVQKTIDGKFHYGGTYKTKEIAIQIVEKLDECGWDLKQLDRIKKEVVG